MESLMPQMAFQFLAIAMALAAFLPALVYSYVKELVDELEQSHEEYGTAEKRYKKYEIKYKEAEKNNDSYKNEIKTQFHEIEKWFKSVEKKFNSVEVSIPGFVYVVDFIVTQSMALVIFSAFVGITIYFSSLWTRNWLYFGMALIMEICCYLIFLIWSYRQINMAKEDVLIRYWKTIKKDVEKKQEKIRGFEFYRNLWFIFTTILFWIIIYCAVDFIAQHYSTLSPAQLKAFYMNQGCLPLHIILGTLSLALIVYATSWLIPLIDYRPLMGRVALILTEINKKGK